MDYSQPNQPLYGGPATPQPGEQPPPPNLKKSRKKNKPEKQVTKKVVNRQLRFAVGFAVVATAAGALTLGGAHKPNLYVVRAADPIAAGAAVTKVDAQFEAVPITKDLVEPGAYTGTTAQAALAALGDDIGDGSRVQYPVTQLAQITKDDFSMDLVLDKPLAKNERLMSIQATVSNAVAGKIRPGDKVDIAAADDKTAAVVFTGVEVVAVTVSENQYQSVADQQQGKAKNTSPDELLPADPVPGIYTVRVDASDVVKLNALASQATLSLIYVPKGGTATPLGVTTAHQVMCQAGGSAAPGC